MGTVQAGDLEARGQKPEEAPTRVQRITAKIDRAGEYASFTIGQLIGAVAFSILGVHFEYAAGAFLLLNAAKIIQLLRIVRNVPIEKPSGIKEMLSGKR